MAREDPTIYMRIPAELKDQLDKASSENRRSLTAEVVSRLQASFAIGKGEDPFPQPYPQGSWQHEMSKGLVAMRLENQRISLDNAMRSNEMLQLHLRSTIKTWSQNPGLLEDLKTVESQYLAAQEEGAHLFYEAQEWERNMVKAGLLKPDEARRGDARYRQIPLIFDVNSGNVAAAKEALEPATVTIKANPATPEEAIRNHTAMFGQRAGREFARELKAARRKADEQAPRPVKGILESAADPPAPVLQRQGPGILNSALEVPARKRGSKK